MAKIIIVDENDNPIGLKERGAKHPTDYIVRTSALWILNSKDQLLLAQRKLNKKHNPGKWGPAVAGTNEEGESYESNIVKEAEEEIGLTGQNFTKGPKILLDKPNKIYCQVFFLKLDRQLEQFKIQEEEVEQIKWFDKEELALELKTNPDAYTQGVHAVFKKLSFS